MSASRAVYHGPNHLQLFTPYDAEFVDALKAQVPSFNRRWDPDTKTWHVTHPFDTVAIKVLWFFFPDAEIDEKPAQRPLFTEPTSCQCDADHRTLLVCQDAPPALVKAAYRILAKTHHPDTGGTADRMRELTSAYKRLECGARS